MKIITFYLPQFHEIPENNKWWGKGFTEWVNVKKATPLFDGHYQPRIPKNNRYYNLLDADTLKWQASLAKKYGIYGFCFYHYWFDGHMLLEKPMELFLKNKSIDINFCISWANEDWTNAWVTTNSKTLISQTYGDKKQWEKHYKYLKQFFIDKRYIKIDNKPLIIIYRPELIPNLNNMLKHLNKLSLEDGFSGLCFAYQHVTFGTMKDKDDSGFEYQIEYQPAYAKYDLQQKSNKIISKIKAIKRKIDIFSQKKFHRVIDLSVFKKNNLPHKDNYDDIWNCILDRKPDSEKSVPGAFVDWDNTPRRNTKGSLVDRKSVV